MQTTWKECTMACDVIVRYIRGYDGQGDKRMAIARSRNPKDKRPTINDIARITGYSKTAVSFAFNDPNRISQKARDQILAVATQIGYIPDPMARNFSLRRHQSIGFLLPQIIHYTLRNPYMMQVIQGIGSVCQKYGYTLTLIPPLNESITDAVRNAAVDGLITIGMKVEMEIVDIMRQRKLPFVTIDGTPSLAMPSVNINDEEAAYGIMRQVLAQGHRNIVIISLPDDAFATGRGDDTSVPTLRKRGYERALKDVGLTLDHPSVTVMVSECTLEDGKHAGHLVSKLKNHPTAIVAMSDIVAIGCILYLDEHGYNIPGDISIVGFDNIQESVLVTPRLTTVDQPAGDKGYMAAEVLFRMINGEDCEDTRMIIPYRIIMRNSLGPVRERDSNAVSDEQEPDVQQSDEREPDRIGTSSDTLQPDDAVSVTTMSAASAPIPMAEGHDARQSVQQKRQ